MDRIDLCREDLCQHRWRDHCCSTANCNGYLSFLTEFDGNRRTKAATDNSTTFTVAATSHFATMEAATAALVSTMEVAEEARTRSFGGRIASIQMTWARTRLEPSVELFTMGWLAGEELTVGATRSRSSWSTDTPNCGGGRDTAPRPGRPGCRETGPSRADRCSVWRIVRGRQANSSSKWWHC